MNKITLLAVDANNNALGQIDGYSSFTGIARFNAVGNWVLELDYDLAQTKLFDRYVGISAVLDGSTIYSGIITGIKRERNDLKNTLTVVGTDGIGMINERLVLPDPVGLPYTSFSYDTRTGVAETVIKNYVKYHAGSLAKLSRQVAGLTVAVDLGRGSTVTGHGRFAKLVPFLTTLAAIGGVGFECLDKVFDIYLPYDLSASIILSETLGSIENFSYEISAPETNYAIVGGLGDLMARAFAEQGDSQSIIDWRLIESFIDYNSTSVVAELLDRAFAELAQKASATKIDLVSRPMVGREPITDYWLGDTVTIVIDGVTFTAKAVEFSVELHGNGIQKVIPTFSNSNAAIGLLHNFDVADALTKIQNLVAR